MKLSDRHSYFLLSINKPTIDDNITYEIRNILKCSDKPIVIDLAGVNSCANSFYNILKEFDNITLINPESIFLFPIYATGFDKFVKIYGEAVSFNDKKRELVNRKLSLV